MLQSADHLGIAAAQNSEAGFSDPSRTTKENLRAAPVPGTLPDCHTYVEKQHHKHRNEEKHQ